MSIWTSQSCYFISDTNLWLYGIISAHAFLSPRIDCSGSTLRITIILRRVGDIPTGRFCPKECGTTQHTLFLSETCFRGVAPRRSRAAYAANSVA